MKRVYLGHEINSGVRRMKFYLLGLFLFAASFLTSFSLSLMALPQTSLALKETEEVANVTEALPSQIIVVPEEVRHTYTPASLMWTLATTSAPWEARDSATSFVFNNKMWMMGGLDGDESVNQAHYVKYWEAPHFNDIWSSADGKEWKLQTEHAEWAKRRSMSVVDFNGKLWMFGGFSPTTGYSSDIWQSEDAVHWKKVLESAPWAPREGQTAEVFLGKIWMLGGVNYDTREVKNDIWFTSDGMTWTQATGTTPWVPRWDHAIAVYKDTLFLSGGMNLSGETFKDVWSSKDGIHWDLLTSNPPWASRQGHSLVVFHDVLWTVGRLNDEASGWGDNDIWFTSDGVTWNRTTKNPLWIGREDHSVVVLDNKMFVYSGMGSDWQWHNDVWVGE